MYNNPSVNLNLKFEKKNKKKSETLLLPENAISAITKRLRVLTEDICSNKYSPTIKPIDAKNPITVLCIPKLHAVESRLYKQTSFLVVSSTCQPWDEMQPNTIIEKSWKTVGNKRNW